jgi:dTDP-4-dehydrorhamnose reductase
MLGRAMVAQARRRGWPALAPSRSQLDLGDPGRVMAAVESFRPELVINCAAYTKVDDCETNQDAAMRINGTAVANAVAAARAVDAKLVHVSSDYVFSGESDRPWREDDPTGPLSVYGASKLEGEHQALADPRALVVRTSWLFGPGGPSFPHTMARLIRAGKVPLRVVDDQFGRPTYTPFLARALADLAQVGATGIVHYGNRPGVSWCELASAVAQLTAPATEVVPVTTAAFPRPARRPAMSILDVSRFEALIGRVVEPWVLGLAALFDSSLGDFT